MAGGAGTTVGSVPGGSAEPATVESVPATAEQLAVDESYKSGESPYEFSQVSISRLHEQKCEL